MNQLARLRTVPSSVPIPTPDFNTVLVDDVEADAIHSDTEESTTAEREFDRHVYERMYHKRVEQEAQIRLAAQDEGAGDSWPELDLAEIYAGGINPPLPTITDRGDGTGLFYPALPNVVFGESGAGKTAMTQWIAAQEVLAGRHVYHVDYETNAYVWLTRFRSLGIPDEMVMTQYHYYNLSEGQRPPKRFHPSAQVAIIDSLTSAIAATGADPNAMDGVEQAYRQMINPFTRAGLAAVIIDHVGHGDKKRMVNSTRKKGIVQGAIYRVEGVEGFPFGRGKQGMSALHLFKDNMGGTGKSIEEVVTTFNMSSDEDGRSMQCFFALPDPQVKLAAEEMDKAAKKADRCEQVYDALCDLVDTKPKPTKTDWHKAAKGEYNSFKNAVAELLETKRVQVIREPHTRADVYVPATWM